MNCKSGREVLILIVVDNGLVPLALRQVSMGAAAVLILIVVDNGLVQPAE